jgi:hypothetical protein
MGCGAPESTPPAGGSRFALAPKPAPPVAVFGRVITAAEDLRREEIKAILRRENELRLSSETQRRFKMVSVKPDGWIGVVEQLQRQVMEMFRWHHSLLY